VTGPRSEAPVGFALSCGVPEKGADVKYFIAWADRLIGHSRQGR